MKLNEKAEPPKEPHHATSDKEPSTSTTVIQHPSTSKDTAVQSTSVMETLLPKAKPSVCSSQKRSLSKRSARQPVVSRLSRDISIRASHGAEITKYRREEHLQKLKNLKLERKFMIEEHKKKMELLDLKIAKAKERETSTADAALTAETFTLSPTSGKLYRDIIN